MKKVCYFLTAAALCVSMTSCLSSLPTTTITPVATNTMNSVSFSELNLSREDYKILNTIEVSSVVTVNYQDSPNNSTITIIKITDDGGYSVELTKNKFSNIIMSTKTSGVLRAGFLTNDYGNIDYNNPEAIARATAFSRLVGMAKEVGGDALIEPIVATNLEEKILDNQKDKKDKKDKGTTFVYHTTASAKVVVIKADN